MLKATTIIEMKKEKEEDRVFFCFFYYAFCFFPFKFLLSIFIQFFLLYISLSRKHIYIYNIQDNMFSNFIPPSDFFFFLMPYFAFLLPILNTMKSLKIFETVISHLKIFFDVLTIYSFRFKWKKNTFLFIYIIPNY